MSETALVGAHVELRDRIIGAILAALDGDTACARTFILVGPSGSGKSRIVREVFRYLQVRQPAPAFWPRLPESPNPLAFRKVLGPDLANLRSESLSLPSFGWWSFQCTDTPDIGPTDILADALTSVRVLLKPLQRAYASNARLLDRLDNRKKDFLRFVAETGWDELNDRLVELAPEVLREIPTVGSWLHWALLLGKSGYRRYQDRQRYLDGTDWGEEIGTSRAQIGEELGKLIESLADRELPTFVVVEDAHLMTADMADLLTRLSQSPAERPVIVLVTASAEADNPDHPVYQDWLRNVGDTDAAAVLQVPILSTDELATLVRSHAPTTSRHDALAVARALPSKSPLVLHMWLSSNHVRSARSRHPDGAIEATPALLATIPTTVGEAFHAAWGQLSGACQAALRLSSALTDPALPAPGFLPDLVAASSLDAAATTLGLRQAVDASWCTRPDAVQAFREPLLATTARHFTSTGINALDADTIDAAKLMLVGALDAWITDQVGRDQWLEEDLKGCLTAAAWFLYLTGESPPSFSQSAKLACRQALAEHAAIGGHPEMVKQLLAESLAQAGLPDTPAILDMRRTLAYELIKLHEFDAAISAFKTLIRTQTTQLGPSHPDVWESRLQLARLRIETGDAASAIHELQDLLNDQIDHDGPTGHRTFPTRRALGGAHLTQGNYQLAMTILEAVRFDSENKLGSDHPSTLLSSNSLASAYAEVGRFADAIALQSRTVADMTRVLGPDHPNTMTAYNNLACAYENAGRRDMAVPLYRQALADRERILGADHPATTTSRHQLGNALVLDGELRHGTSLLERALADSQSVLGPTSPHTGTIRGELGYAYLMDGRHEEALSLLEQAADDSERILGHYHPDTLRAQSNLALGYTIAGEVKRAIQLHEQVLAARERALAPTDPDTLRSRTLLAGAHLANGEQDYAIELLERICVDAEQILPAGHPDIVAVHEDAAEAYWARHRTADVRRATDHLLEALAAATGILRPDSRTILNIRTKLAMSYQEAGDFELAIPQYEELLDGAERVLDRENPIFRASLECLVFCISNAAPPHWTSSTPGRPIPWFQSALTHAERALGPNDPDISTFRRNLAVAHAKAGDIDSAISLFEQALSDLEIALGPNHSESVACREDLTALLDQRRSSGCGA